MIRKCLICYTPLRPKCVTQGRGYCSTGEAFNDSTADYILVWECPDCTSTTKQFYESEIAGRQRYKHPNIFANYKEQQSFLREDCKL